MSDKGLSRAPGWGTTPPRRRSAAHRPPTTEAVWVPARVYWEGQLFSARTPEGVEEWECRAPEPLRAVELLRDKVAFGLHVPSARVRFLFATFPRGYNPPAFDRCVADETPFGTALQGLAQACERLTDFVQRPDVQEALQQWSERDPS